MELKTINPKMLVLEVPSTQLAKGGGTATRTERIATNIFWNILN
jgi:hypothetical protein